MYKQRELSFHYLNVYKRYSKHLSTFYFLYTLHQKSNIKELNFLTNIIAIFIFNSKRAMKHPVSFFAPYDGYRESYRRDKSTAVNRAIGYVP